MNGPTIANRIIERSSPQELLDTQAYLTVPMLAKIWNVKPSAARARLTNAKGPFFAKAFQNGGQWQIETTDYKRIINGLKVVNDRDKLPSRPHDNATFQNVKEN